MPVAGVLPLCVGVALAMGAVESRMLMGTFAVTTLVTSIAEVEAVPKQVAASLEVASETTEAMTVSTAVIVEELFGETIRGLSHLPTLAGVLRVQRTYFFVIGEPPQGGFTRRRRSGFNYSRLYGASYVFGQNLCGVARQLKLSRWYTLALGFASVTTLLLNLVLVLSAFVSYRLPGLGGANLYRDTTLSEEVYPVPILHDRYLDVTEWVLQMEQDPLVYHSDGLDPTREFWWLPPWVWGWS